jgi:hypothetical protein
MLPEVSEGLYNCFSVWNADLTDMVEICNIVTF